MPLPKPHKKEKQRDFIDRCMGDSVMNQDYPDNKQRAAVCYSQWRNKKKEDEKVISPNDKLRILVWGMGLETEHAAKMADEGNTVYNYTVWQDTFARFEKAVIGDGFPGVTNTFFPFEQIEETDMICFFDIGWGDLADWLRKKGYTVLGAGRGEMLEIKRFEFRQLQKAIGLPTQPTWEIEGLDNLRKFLAGEEKVPVITIDGEEIMMKGHDNIMVKIDLWRGNIESFHAATEPHVDYLLDRSKVDFGPYKNKIKFVLEEFIETKIEFGVDTFHNGKHFIWPCSFGVEFKSAFIGKWCEKEDLPPCLQNTIEKLEPILAASDYRGPISTEERAVNKDLSYLIDMTCRYAYPLSAAFTEALNDYSMTMYHIARGDDVRLDVKAKYFGCLPLESPEGEKFWERVDFDPKLRNSIKFRTAVNVDGTFHTTPGFVSLVTLVAIGDSPEEVAQKLYDLIPEVSAYKLETDMVSGPNEILKKIEELRKWGVDF
jgi:hypothetical protein